MATDNDDRPEGEFFSGADRYQEYFQSAMVKVLVGRNEYARAFYAHEGVLLKSSFFKAALNGNFRESITREVELPEDDPESFSSVLEFLYGEEYSPRLIMKKPSGQQEPQPQPQPRPLHSGGLFGNSSSFIAPQQSAGAFGQANLFTSQQRSQPQVTSANTEPGSRIISGYEGAKVNLDKQGAAALRHAKIYCLAEKLELGDLQTLVLEKLRLCGPVKNIHFIRVAAFLVEGSSDTRGVLSAFLTPYVQGIP